MNYSHNIIHCFDPGVKTGYVKYNREVQEIINYKILKSYYEIGEILSDVCKYNEMVLYELNHGILSTSDQFTMCKIVGFIEGYCETYNYNYKGQIPGKRKGFVQISKNYFKNHIKVKDYEVHNIDAFSHVLAYIHKKEGIEKFRC